MDVQERLNSEDLVRPDYVAASHLHRYAVAADLCDGMRVLDLCCGNGYGTRILAGSAAAAHGVDVDPTAIAQAEATYSSPNTTFHAEDAHGFLRRIEPGYYEAIVMFEGLERLAEHEDVIEQLRRLNEGGVRVIVSVPNSRALPADNPFRVNDFGYDEARRAFRRFSDVTFLFQHLAEGSLVLPAQSSEGFAGELAALEQAEPEYANTFIAVAGFDRDAVRRATARLNLVVTPSHNRHVVDLERANEELRRENRQLARGTYGKHDAAAAAAAADLEAQIATERARSRALQERLEEAERALHRQAAASAPPQPVREPVLDQVLRAAESVPQLQPFLKNLSRRRIGRGR